MGREQGGQGPVESHHISAMGSMGGTLEEILDTELNCGVQGNCMVRDARFEHIFLRIERRKSFQPGGQFKFYHVASVAVPPSLLAVGQSAFVSMITEFTRYYKIGLGCQKFIKCQASFLLA